MSFGFSIGDIISVSTLAWQVFKSCKDAPGEFKNVAGEVISLHVVLKETAELAAQSDLSSHQNPQLQKLTRGCQEVLQELTELLKKYQSLGTKTQRTWDRLKWGSEGVASLRARLISNTTMVSAYNTTMVNSSVARIERQLSQFMEEVRSGKREGSVISSGTKCLEENEEAEEEDGGWLQMRRELEDIGVTPDAFSQHKGFIVNWFQQALAEDQADGRDETPEQTESSNTEEESILIHQRPRLLPRDSSLPTYSISDYTPENARATIIEEIPQSGELLLLVSKAGDLDSVDYLLRHGVDVNAKYYERGNMTALNTAAMYGHFHITQRLLTEPNIDVNNKNHLGYTPLSLASWFDRLDVVQLLLDHSTTVIDPTDGEEGRTPLSLAAERGNALIVDYLLTKGANPNSQDRQGRTPLAWAAEKGRFQETKLLLEVKLIMPNRSDRYGITPLAQAVESGNNTVVYLFLAHPDTDFDAADCNLMTPLDRARRKGYYDMIPLFERARAKRIHSESGPIKSPEK